MGKTIKCGYNKCKCEDILTLDTAISYKNKKYHRLCLNELNNKAEIRNLFYKHINEKELPVLLNSTINNIIHEKNISSEFLLFALNYVIKNKINLNRAMGLHYIIIDEKIINAYNKHLTDIQIKNIKLSNEIVEEVKFDINIIKDKKDTWDFFS